MFVALCFSPACLYVWLIPIVCWMSCVASSWSLLFVVCWPLIGGVLLVGFRLLLVVVWSVFLVFV